MVSYGVIAVLFSNVCDFFVSAVPKNMTQKRVQEMCPRIQHTCLRNIFKRNLSLKRGKEMSSRRDMSNKSLMGEGAPPN